MILFVAAAGATIGIIKNCFSFVAGTVAGVYVAQNYKLPNIADQADNVFKMVKDVHQRYRND